MKLIRFGNRGEEKPGIMYNGERRDCSAVWKDWNNRFFTSDGLKDLQRQVSQEPEQFPLVDESERWAAPIARPATILCIGLNYSDHAKESGMPIPEEPILFMKSSNTINGPYDSVRIPTGSTKTDWEVELGFVLKRNVYQAENTAEGWEAIAGYTIVNDLSEREYQLERGGQWVKGKSCPGFSPTGPFLATPDEVPDAMQLKMTLDVNGLSRQNGSTSTMIFNPGYIVWYVSQFMELEAGDLISTGTPPGVGLGMDPPQFLRAGDKVRLSIDYLGIQEQQFQ